MSGFYTNLGAKMVLPFPHFLCRALEINKEFGFFEKVEMLWMEHGQNASESRVSVNKKCRMGF